MGTYSLLDGQSGRPGPGSSGTQPPVTADSYSGGYTAGMVFCVLTAAWLTGYQIWVPSVNGNTAPQPCCLWQAASNNSGVIVPGAGVTTPVLQAGQLNTVMLATPLALAPLFPYVCASGMNSTSPAGFPLTQNQFGAGNPYSAGITNGPLSAYPSGSVPWAEGSQVVPLTLPQSPFVTNADPTISMPVFNDANDILWVGPIVTDVPPAGALYSMFPNIPGGFNGTIQASSYTLGLEFYVTQPCLVRKIKLWSPAGSVVLPSRTGIWVVSSQQELAGSDNQSPAWLDYPGGGAASPGDGQVYADYTASGLVLPANVRLKASVYANAGSSDWFAASPAFFGPVSAAGGIWSAGVTSGPLVVVGNSGSTQGQSSWNYGAGWTYPGSSTNPEWDGLDIEVEPVSAGFLRAGHGFATAAILNAGGDE